jgi:hypothetical protein
MSAPFVHGGLGTYTVTADDVENARQIEEQLHGRDPGGGRGGKALLGRRATGCPSGVRSRGYPVAERPHGGV